MKRILTLLLLASLTGCSSFKLGGMVYCPFGADCSFMMKSSVPVPAPEPAASGPSA